MLWRCCLSRSLSVRTTMSGLTGVVQEAGVPGCPSISQTQRRHDPKGASWCDRQRLGTDIPAFLAAMYMVSPDSAVTIRPLICRFTGSPLPTHAELIREMFNGGQHRVWSTPS